ncbi:MAG: hypothetical protein ABH950_07945 [Candidatus Altiarchaeota archaeon]
MSKTVEKKVVVKAGVEVAQIQPKQIKRPPGTAFVLAALDTDEFSDPDILDNLIKNRIILPLTPKTSANGTEYKGVGERIQLDVEWNLKKQNLPYELDQIYFVPVHSMLKGIPGLHARSANIDVPLELVGVEPTHSIKGPGVRSYKASETSGAYAISLAEEIFERQGQGFAFIGTTRTAIKVSQELQAEFEKARREGDPIIRRAIVRGITEVFTVKPGAVFRPLQQIVYLRHPWKFLEDYQEDLLPDDKAYIQGRMESDRKTNKHEVLKGLRGSGFFKLHNAHLWPKWLDATIEKIHSYSNEFTEARMMVLMEEFIRNPNKDPHSLTQIKSFQDSLSDQSMFSNNPLGRETLVTVDWLENFRSEAQSIRSSQGEEAYRKKLRRFYEIFGDDKLGCFMAIEGLVTDLDRANLLPLKKITYGSDPVEDLKDEEITTPTIYSEDKKLPITDVIDTIEDVAREAPIVKNMILRDQVLFEYDVPLQTRMGELPNLKRKMQKADFETWQKVFKHYGLDLTGREMGEGDEVGLLKVKRASNRERISMKQARAEIGTKFVLSTFVNYHLMHNRLNGVFSSRGGSSLLEQNTTATGHVVDLDTAKTHLEEKELGNQFRKADEYDLGTLWVAMAAKLFNMEKDDMGRLARNKLTHPFAQRKKEAWLTYKRIALYGISLIKEGKEYLGITDNPTE